MKAQKKGRVGPLVLLFFLIFLSGSILVFVKMSSLRSVTVENCTYYKDEKLLSLLGVPKKANTIKEYIALKYGKKQNVPFIDDYDVSLDGIDGLTIKVYEKDIIGCIPYMGEYVCFDADGVMVGSIKKVRDDVPVVNGIEYGGMVYNNKVETGQNEIFSRVLNVTQLIKKYGVTVNEITFDSSMNVTLTCGNIMVELGNGTHFDTSISNLPELIAKATGLKGTLHMENYASGNGKVVFEKKS